MYHLRWKGGRVLLNQHINKSAVDADPYREKNKIDFTDIGLYKVINVPNKAMQEIIKLFPKTRYYGSKKRILNWI